MISEKEKSLAAFYDQSIESFFLKKTIKLADLIAVLADRNQDICLNDLLDIKDEFPNFWKDFYQTFKYFDFTHPGFSDLFEGRFVDFVDKSLEYFDVIGYLENKKYSSYSKKEVFNIISSHDLYKVISKYIKDIPQNTSVLTRFITNASHRKTARNKKKTQNVNLEAVNKRIYELWDKEPHNFELFYRGYSPYMEDMAEANNRIKSLVDIGCGFLADQIKENIESFKQNFMDVYCGFNRIKLANASVILAKVNGFKVIPNPDVKSFDSCSEYYLPLNYIPYQVDKEYLDNIIISRTATNQVLNKLYPNNSKLVFKYKPSLYVLEEVLDCIESDEVKALFLNLESFQGLGFKPAFDHYKVLIPGIEMGLNEEDQKTLDFEFVKEGVFHPIVIGEKDGKCYFISYWK